MHSSAHLIKVLQMERRLGAHTQGSQLTLPDFFVWIIILINLSSYLLTHDLEAEMDFSPSNPHLTSLIPSPFLCLCSLLWHLSSSVLHLPFLFISSSTFSLSLHPQTPLRQLKPFFIDMWKYI